MEEGGAEDQGTCSGGRARGSTGGLRAGGWAEPQRLQGSQVELGQGRPGEGQQGQYLQAPSDRRSGRELGTEVGRVLLVAMCRP